MIELRNASKSFGKVSAVKDVSFRMKEENVFGLIGTKVPSFGWRPAC